MRKRLLSLVLIVAVLAMSVSGILGAFSVSAGGTYDTVPAMVQTEGMREIYDGIRYSGTLEAGALSENYLPGYGSSDNITISDPAFNTYDYFELDFYTDSAANFSARVSKLQFVVRRDNSTIKLEFQDQITEDGWNHVKIPISGDSWVLSSGYVRFYITKNASDTGATDRYRLGNICATMDDYNIVPAMPDVTPRFDIYEGAAFAGTFGSTVITGQGHLPGYSPAAKTFSNPGLSTYDYFELDFFIDSYANFTARNTRMYLNLRSGDGNGTSRGTLEFTDKFTGNGWNHIKVSTSSLTSTILNEITIVRVYIDIDAGETGATDRYKVANICLSKEAYSIVPAMVQSDGMLEIYDGMKYSGTLGSDSIDDNYFTGYSADYITVSNPNLLEYDNFELDFYTDNAANFSARVSILNFVVRRDNKAAKYDFHDQIINDGWNHVIIPITWETGDEKWALQNGNVRFWITMNASDTGATDRYRLGNICATSKVGFASHSLVLTDAIGVNFFMDLSELTAEEKADSYMSFDVNGATKTAEFDSTFTGNGGTYGFTCYVSSVEMAEAITPTFHYGSKTVVGAPYAVKDYIDYVVANSGSYTSEVVSLVKAIGDYGHYAQEYLGPKNGWTAGTDYTAIAKYRAADYGTDDYTAKASAIVSAGKAVDASGVTSGTSNGQFRYALNLDSKTSLIVQFFYGSSITVDTSYTGTIARDVATNDYILYLAYMPISEFGDNVSITGVIDGTDYTITVSGLSYVNGVLNSGTTSTALKNAVSALYDYYSAATAYQTSLS